MMYESVNNTIKLSGKTSWLPVGGAAEGRGAALWRQGNEWI